jgi:lysophospholipase L1-like esterase
VSLIAAASVTSQVSVSGGGSPTATASDVTTIAPQSSSILAITNQGPDAVNFAGFLITGESGTTNVTQSNNCPATMATGTTCDVTLSFNAGSPIIPPDWALFGQYAAADQQLISGAPDPTRLVFIGDSITLYWDQPAPYGEGSLSSVQPFVNRGIVGQTTEQMLVRFWEDVVKLQPAVVHIFGGTNDLGGNTGPETNAEIMDQLTSMTEVAQANGIKVLIASITPVVDTATNTWTDRRPTATIEALNQLIQTLCEQTGAIYVDYFSVLADSNGNMNLNLTVDGLHPNTAGYALMVPVAQQALAKLGY